MSAILLMDRESHDTKLEQRENIVSRLESWGAYYRQIRHVGPQVKTSTNLYGLVTEARRAKRVSGENYGVISKNKAYASLIPSTAHQSNFSEELETDKAIDALPPDESLIIAHVYAHRLSQADIAHKMKMSPQWVNNQLNQALRFLSGYFHKK